MKFILDCVGCCRTDDRHPEASSPWREETPFLLVPDRPIRNRRNRKRGRDWRPSLSAISEDVVVVDTERVKKRIVNAGSETRRSGKISPGASTTRSHVGRHNGGDSGGYSLPAFMPTAFASPFMF